MSIGGDIDKATSGVLSFALSPVRALLRKGLHVLAGWARTIFSLVGVAWDDLVGATMTLLHGAEVFAQSTWYVLGYVTTVLVPRLAHWTATELRHLDGLLSHAVARLDRAVDHAITKAWSELDHGLHWLVQTFVTPLEHRIGTVEHYLTRDVRQAVDLLTHPSRLTSFLLEHLLDDAGSLSQRLIAPLARWFRASAVRDTVATAHQVEAVLAALL